MKGRSRHRRLEPFTVRCIIYRLENSTYILFFFLRMFQAPVVHVHGMHAYKIIQVTELTQRSESVGLIHRKENNIPLQPLINR